ncbi:MAG TPA: FmdB family transcriptional regulator, partial [Spirochaetaceae bacterium]|nr:FmdB family transcriptional regulator [Spirochaetaceae bacterium]
FEKFQAMSDAPVKICPQCGGRVRRMIGGGSGIIFKGSGFYINDSRKSTVGATGISKSPSEPKGEAKSSKEEKTPPSSGSSSSTASSSSASAAGATAAGTPAAKAV